MSNLSTFPSPQEFVAQLRSGNRRMLSKAITLAESTQAAAQTHAQKIISEALPYTGNAKRIAITGVPGAGKSTFIEQLGLHAIHQGAKVAVLAIDPSSSISGGSILGDKTRMEQLTKEENAFIRPSANAGNLGGIASRTYEAMLLCEAAGFDLILVETVGVGQSETLVHDITDLFLYLHVSGTGDDLQGVKRGIMEMADIIFVNKTDLHSPAMVNATLADLHRSVQFLPHKENQWKRKILKGSALSTDGISDLWELIGEYFHQIKEKGWLEKNRNQQKEKRVLQYTEEKLWQHFLAFTQSEEGKNIQLELLKTLDSPYEIAEAWFAEFVKKKV